MGPVTLAIPATVPIPEGGATVFAVVIVILVVAALLRWLGS